MSEKANDGERQQRALEALRDAIMKTFQDHGEFPTRWVLLAEGVGVEDNLRGLWVATSEDAKPWDTLGMLMHATHMEQARTVWVERPED